MVNYSHADNSEKAQIKVARMHHRIVNRRKDFHLKTALEKGTQIKTFSCQHYVCRLKEASRRTRRHSTFWVGLYGKLWVENTQSCHHWVEQLMSLTPHKLPFYQQGQIAQQLILSLF